MTVETKIKIIMLELDFSGRAPIPVPTQVRCALEDLAAFIEKTQSGEDTAE